MWIGDLVDRAYFEFVASFYAAITPSTTDSIILVARCHTTSTRGAMANIGRVVFAVASAGCGAYEQFRVLNAESFGGRVETLQSTLFNH